jgi:pimeloyl-ACP methyl ester carboxylesterase
MERSCRFKNLDVFFTDEGKGRAIVFLHGYPESKEVWMEFTKSFTKTYRIICIDLPGFGKTASIGYIHTMELMAECVKKVMDEIGLRKYALVGHSMGGYVALAFAELFEKNTLGISLFHSTALPDSEEKKTDRNRAISIVKQNHKHYVMELIPKLFAPNSSGNFSDKVDFLKNIFINTSQQGIINALEGMKIRADRTSILKKASFPVQFIIGAHDQILLTESLIEQSSLCKISHLLLLEKSGHIGFFEEPEVCQMGIRKFLRMCFK